MRSVHSMFAVRVVASLILVSGTAATARAQAWLPAKGEGTVSVLFTNVLSKDHYLPDERFETATWLIDTMRNPFSAAPCFREAARIWRIHSHGRGDFSARHAALALTNAAVCLSQLDDHAQAETLAREALALRPELADGWNNLGTVRLRLGKDDEAERAFAEAIRLKPDFALARDNAALVRKKRFDELTARGLWADAVHRLERDPNAGAGDVERLISAARALNESGHWAEAEQALKLAIRFDPNSAIAHGYLGFIRFSHHRLDEAIPELVRAVELDPNDANPRFSLALARMASGDAAGARAERDALAQVDAKRAADLDAILNRR